MATIPISLTITPTAPDTITAVSVVTLTRSDNGQAPSGVSLPIALSLTSGTSSSGTWTGSFPDASPPATYNFSFTLTYGDGSVSQPIAGDPIPGGALPTGYYASQQSVEKVFGVANVAIWSNRDDQIASQNGIVQSDPTQVQASLDRTDAYINWLASIYKYQTPLPTTIAAWLRLNHLASEDAGVELYLGRGVYDKGDELAGKFTDRRRELRGFFQGGKKIPGEIEQFFIEGIPDAPRLGGTVNKAPAIILSPVVAPYGGENTFSLPSQQIPTLP